MCFQCLFSLFTKKHTEHKIENHIKQCHNEINDDDDDDDDDHDHDHDHHHHRKKDIEKHRDL